MSEAPKRAELYVIVKRAVDSLGESTADQRHEIYKFAYKSIEGFSYDSGDSNYSMHINSIKEVSERVEIDHISRQREIIPPLGPSPLAPDLVVDGGYAADPPLNVVQAVQPQERTALFLKNMGAGGAVSLVKILIQLALLPLMAHLLGPKEFGIYALAVPVVAFLAVIADGGVGFSLARERTNSPVIWSTAFWILMIGSAILSIIVILSGYLLALASSEPKLNGLMLILAISFPFLSLGILPVARLIRQGNLVAIAVADLFATVSGAICAVSLGILGYGAKSLAFQFLISYIIRTLILNLFAFEKPKAIFQPATMLEHLSSGGILMGGRIADLACRSGESLLFGNAFGSATLGAYNFANQVSRFLFEACSNPTWAALYSQSLSEKHDHLLKIFYKVSRLMAFLTFPVAAVLAAAGPDILAQALGPSWQEAGIFLRVLAAGYALSLTASMGTALLLALDANLTFFLTVLLLGISRVVVVVAGQYVSALDTVWLITVVNILYSIGICLCVTRFTDAKVLRILREVAGPFFAALVSGAVCWIVLSLGGNKAIIVYGSLVVATLCYFAAMFLFEGKNLRSELFFIRSATFGIIKKR